ncbi:hypothetical protein [Actinomyces ruminis]|uniref:hypothetical protein n=1 Tax=Actinomyces ruminis TaxID=1937003 RepID=UPI0011780C22|nr:hypothetical protein [Actinomyces ruminis]
MSEQRAPADMDASWAPIGWEPSDIGLDDAPFGTVLGDPLMGSPIFDVSVLDAAPTSDAEETQPRPAQAPSTSRPTAAAPPSSRSQHQQVTQRASHRQSTTRPQARPSSRPVSATSGYGLVSTAVGTAPDGPAAMTAVQQAPGTPGGTLYARACSCHRTRRQLPRPTGRQAARRCSGQVRRRRIPTDVLRLPRQPVHAQRPSRATRTKTPATSRRWWPPGSGGWCSS